MPVDDLWYSSRERGPDGRALPTKRHGRGKRWRVRSPGLPALSFDRKVDAERADAERRTDLARGTYIDPSAGREFVAAYAERWRQGQVYRASSSEHAERAFRLHINPKLGRLAMADVRHSQVQAWAKGLDLSPATVRVVFAFLTAMFAAAVRDRVIASNPCAGVKLPALPRTNQLILTPNQVHALAEHLPERYRALVYVGAGCGLRHGEAIGLEVEHVDFLRRELHVRQQVSAVSGRPPYLAPPKTLTSRRTVELPSVTAEALARHLQRFPAQPVEVVDETGRRAVERQAWPLFPSSSGQLLHRSAWSALWRPAARSVELPPRTGFHALRHYYASLLIHAGASVKTVQMALGHSTPSMTLDVYTSLWPDQLDRTRSLVDEALSTPDLHGAGADGV